MQMTLRWKLSAVTRQPSPNAGCIVKIPIDPARRFWLECPHEFSLPRLLFVHETQ